MSADGIADDRSVEAQIPRPAEPGKFRRYVGELRKGVRWIRECGVPHEETVAIPVLALVICCRVFSGSSIPIWVPGVLLTTVNVVCGAWLGLAWTGLPAFKVLLRIIYIAVLGILGVMLTSHEAISKKEAVDLVASMMRTLGLVFYSSWFTASCLRDTLLKRFYSQKQRDKYMQQMAWYRYIWELARDRADKSTASDFDYAVATVIRNSLHPGGLAIWFALLSGLLIKLWYFCGWLTAN